MIKYFIGVLIITSGLITLSGTPLITPPINAQEYSMTESTSANNTESTSANNTESTSANNTESTEAENLPSGTISRRS